MKQSVSYAHATHIHTHFIRSLLDFILNVLEENLCG